MSSYSKIHSLVLLLLLAIPNTLIAASIPDELIGSWSASTDDFCGIEFTSKGYTGSADGEGHGCEVKSVRKLFKGFSENPMWRMAFICAGEFGSVRVNSLIRLQTFKGVRFMANVETLSPKDLKKAEVAPVSILYKCPQISKTSPLLIDLLKYATLPNFADDPNQMIKLKDGHAEGTFNGYGHWNEILDTDAGAYATGDFNNDGAQDIAAIITASGGGSGSFSYLTIFLNDSGALRYLTSQLLGDRIIINKISYENVTCPRIFGPKIT